MKISTVIAFTSLAFFNVVIPANGQSLESPREPSQPKDGLAEKFCESTSFSEFEAQAWLPEDGFYLIDGDIAVRNRDEFRAIYDSMCGDGRPASEDNTRSIVQYYNGERSVWTPTQALNLTYCISDNSIYGFSLGSTYNNVRIDMESATEDWEGHANVDFEYLGPCDENPNAFFTVQRWRFNSNGDAVAFFPHQPSSDRILLINNVCAADRQCNNDSAITLRGLLRHELGHVLGLAHEHQRAPNCPAVGVEGVDWEALTSYDIGSVMHYRRTYLACSNIGGDYRISNRDKEGIAELYPLPSPPVNNMPNAQVMNLPQAEVGDGVVFDGSGSYDPDGTIVLYSWNYGDGTSSSSPSSIAIHAYNSAGLYTPTLTVTDNLGSTDSQTTVINIVPAAPPPNTPPSASLTGPSTAVQGIPIALSASGSTDIDGSITTYEWFFGDGNSQVTSTPSITHAYSRVGEASPIVIVYDDDGASDSAAVTIEIKVNAAALIPVFYTIL